MTFPTFTEFTSQFKEHQKQKDEERKQKLAQDKANLHCSLDKAFAEELSNKLSFAIEYSQLYPLVIKKQVEWVGTKEDTLEVARVFMADFEQQLIHLGYTFDFDLKENPGTMYTIELTVYLEPTEELPKQECPDDVSIEDILFIFAVISALN